MIDTKTRLSPGWRLDRLARKLALRQRECRPLYERYNGEQPLPEHLRDAPDTAKTFFRASRTAFAELIVKTLEPAAPPPPPEKDENINLTEEEVGFLEKMFRK